MGTMLRAAATTTAIEYFIVCRTKRRKKYGETKWFLFVFLFYFIVISTQLHFLSPKNIYIELGPTLCFNFKPIFITSWFIFMSLSMTSVRKIVYLLHEWRTTLCVCVSQFNSINGNGVQTLPFMWMYKVNVHSVYKVYYYSVVSH